MYIAYRTSSSNIYASLAECTRDGEKYKKNILKTLAGFSTRKRAYTVTASEECLPMTLKPENMEPWH